MSAGAPDLPAHKKSYQLGVLATPVQIRTDPSASNPNAVDNRREASMDNYEDGVAVSDKKRVA